MPTTATPSQDAFGFFTDRPFAVLDVHQYERAISSCPERQAYAAIPTYENASALTRRIWTTIVETMAPGTAILLSSSTGKDSSLLLYTWVQFMLARLSAGLPVPQVVVGMSDTGSEFPDMEARMKAECTAINAWASANGYPLEAQIVQPPAKSRLLVELIGRGKALPIQKSGSRRDGRGWCMDRVKSEPLQRLLDEMEREYPAFLNAIGTRTDESGTRKGKMVALSVNLPFGLTAIKRPYDDAGDPPDLGSVPIGHWTNEMVAMWMGSTDVPWRADSQRELRTIYHKAATMDEVVGECGLRITQEGRLSNTCSDLSGTRMGCWHCFLTQNKSLANMAASDSRYEWLRRVHRYIYRHHLHNDWRIAERERHGFTEHTLFPKAFTFRERYWMLMLVFRAEMESGFTLLQQEDIDAIRRAWKREGVWTVDPLQAQLDAGNWRRSGKPEMSFERNTGELFRAMRFLSEGIPVSAYYHLLEQDRNGKPHFQALALSQLVGLSGFAVPLVPTLLAYVFRDTSAPDEVFVMVTDIPGNLGTKLDGKKFNGTHLGHWHCVGVREAVAWERRWGRGRIMYYRYNRVAISRRIDAMRAADPTNRKLCAVVATFGTNEELRQDCTLDNALSEYWTGINQTIAIAGRMDQSEYAEFKEVLITTFLLSTVLHDRAEHARAKLRAQFRDRLTFLHEDSDRGKLVRSEFEAAAKERYNPEAQIALVREYLQGFQYIASLLNRGLINAALIERLLMLLQSSWIDEKEEAALKAFESHLLRRPQASGIRLAA